ncbi:hypothetical protein Y1Q_0013847 [Alligator mississippiensis]|uniref:Uncharacterized protein n=1 Tax=Alligator mississippiensis TaxID=8496 RepID=A0A151NFQ7_ALLMI|nr:hypothetical protein Y1Q_0013847 [Alligator mississippiensis]
MQISAPGLLGSCNTRTAYYEFPWPRPRSLASGTKKTLADMTREARTPSSIKKFSLLRPLAWDRPFVELPQSSEDAQNETVIPEMPVLFFV